MQAQQVVVRAIILRRLEQGLQAKKGRIGAVQGRLSYITGMQ